MRNGQGKFTYADGSYWSGEYKDDHPWTGSGKCYFGDGCYDGELKCGERNGQGKLTYANGDIYEGNYLNDMWNGQGKYTFLNDYSWVGEYKDGYRWNGSGEVRVGNYIRDMVTINGRDIETRKLRQKNLCQHCGSEFKGLIKKICSKCGKPKDY